MKSPGTGRNPATERPQATTIGALVRELAITRPDDLSLVCNDTRLTWSDLADQVARVGAGLLELGIEPGDRVAAIAANSAEWIVTDLAAASIGAVFMGLNTWYKADDLNFVLRHSGARVVVCGEQLFGRPLLPMVRDVVAQCPDVEHLIVIGEPAPGTLSWTQLAQTDPARINGTEAAPSDPAAILYTSGTTADPKGVVLHHHDLITNGWEIGERQRLTSDDRLWLGIPLFFSFGSANALMAALTHGVALIVQEKFDPAAAVDLIESEQCSVYYGMGHMTRSILDERDRRGMALPSLRTGLTIGPPETFRMTAELVPGICNVYGLTETYGNCAVTDCTEPLELRATSQGEPLPGFTIRIVDPTTHEPVRTGETGLILVQGRVTSGYFRDTDRTEEAFPSPGWFDTGDMGSLDADGRIRYSGRAKEMLKVSGINVSPVGVENVLLTYPGVRQAFVVGRPDTDRGELPVAVVEWDAGAGADTDPAALDAHCRKHLPSYAVPVDYVAVTDGQLPRTGTGKVRRAELAALVDKDFECTSSI